MASFVPPHSLEAEKAVLGALLKEPTLLNVVSDLLLPEHFFSDVHRQIFDAMVQLDAVGEPSDIVTVAEKLRGGDSQEVSPGFLIELTESAPVAQNLLYYANIVRKHSNLRRVISLCQNTIGRATNNDGDIGEFLDSIEKEIISIVNDQDRQGGIISAVQVLEDTIIELEEKLKLAGQPTGTPSGFTDFDAMTGGFQNSDLIILAARPAMGKTALMLNFASNAAKNGKPTVVFSLEMSKNQLMTRLLSAEARVDSSKLRRGELSDDELNRLHVASRTIASLPIGIDETGGITLMELRSRCRRWKKDHGLGLVVIDYLQLMGATSKRADSREREIAELSGGLKALAKELQVPVIALAQLNRGPDQRTDHRPKSSDLRESGSLEQDADLIMFIYRDEYYNPNSEDRGKAEVIIAKNRHGSVDTIKLAYQANYVSFYNLLK
ncbi:MAG: replicative DNA helicase [Proteobacteria bacterium]|nr:replicative DNA helicase [Pseudomonadota bacterium]